MFSRVLSLALCLVCAPAFAANLEITEDAVIDFSTPGVDFIHVRGDATLTVRGDLDVRVVSSIKLFDTASLVLEGGRIEKGIWFLGSDNRADFLGGRFDNYFSGNGSGVVNIDGTTEFSGDFSFSGGTQAIDVHRFEHYALAPTVRDSVGATVTLYTPTPWHSLILFDAADFGRRLGSVVTSAGTSHIAVEDSAKWRILQSDSRPDGDTNGDFKVDIADLNNVRNYFGTNDYRGEAFPLDGIVNINDLNTIRNSFGTSSVATPEPSSIAMVVIASCLLCQIRHRCPSTRRA